MTRETYYIKRGGRYQAISEYDSDFMDSFPYGGTLVVCNNRGLIYRHHVDPAFAPLIAAGIYAEDAISDALMQASLLKHKSRETPLTPGQKAAWENLIKEFGDDARQLEWPSAREAAQAGAAALVKQAEKLLEYPAVKKAYDNFMLISKLALEGTKDE